MHELYITECILKATRDALPPRLDPAKVQTVCVRVGQLDAVSTESLAFLFDAVKGTHGMACARLEISEESVLCRCDCGNEFSVSVPTFECPACHGASVRVVKGRGITLERIICQDEV
jgi:hydrogenase nickel insertion protein HypA